MNVSVYDIQGKEKGSIELNEKVFNIKPNRSAMYYSLRTELTNARHGTASTKGRSEVKGSGAKPWRQKGTGRARAGSRQSPIWVGGGVAFGPRPRNYGIRISKKIKRLSIRSILSLKASENLLKVVEDFSLDSGKTKEFYGIATTLVDRKKRKRVLFIDKNQSELKKRAERNLGWVKYHNADLLCTKDLFFATQLILTESAVKALNEKYAEE